MVLTCTFVYVVQSDSNIYYISMFNLQLVMFYQQEIPIVFEQKLKHKQNILHYSNDLLVLV